MKKWLIFALALALCGSACAETLKTGARGDEVLALQQRLAELGYLSGGADGIYGGQTADAVEMFQQMNGLTVTGAADDKTQALLLSDDARVLLPTLKRNSKGDVVLALQEKLILLDFMSAEADGFYGNKTIEAVKAFQEHLVAQGVKVSVTGAADGVTRETLMAEDYSTFVRILQMGDSDPEVKRLEARLDELGWLDAEPDEFYDDHTAAVVAAFQSASGLEATGAADRATVDAMYVAEPARTEKCVPRDAAPGDYGDAVRRVQRVMIRHGLIGGVDDGSFGDELVSALTCYYDYLVRDGSDLAALLEDRGVISVETQQAMEAEELVFIDAWDETDRKVVRRVQNRLHTLFYMHSRQLDGSYGAVTREALEAFQEKNGLEVTGIADEATQRVLFSSDAVHNGTFHLLEVSIDDQRVYVWQLREDGGYDKIDEFICSTGIWNPTPRGIWMETVRVCYWHHFKNFDEWAQYSYQITGPFMFHSILYAEADESTLFPETLEALGTPASHGCVRLLPEDAGWIFENCAAGTVVVIH